ncbi:MAG: chromosome segregation protein SMC [Spartobacteria bacterium]|nr:chromosome segregation protein SMC [Spartobacteria bacterium]
MKILELRFKNLNSLYGHWFIDFTVPEYVSDGIFALTGPTGAGKSTILDAICLALYGMTPRLGKITKSSNEIMSRQTGECFAEVLFESQAGRYRCYWAQHRSRKKADGELQHPRHEISEGIGDGKIIESQLRRVLAVIEEKTGMDFERFTRSMLLAQGAFDTFLKADVEEKSRILEQITGTEIYTDISKAVHERLRSEKDQLNVLQAEKEGLVLLDDERVSALQHELDEKTGVLTEKSGQKTQLDAAFQWRTGISRLQKELEALEKEISATELAIIDFEPRRLLLQGARKASELDGAFATLTATRKQQFDDRQALKKLETGRPELEQKLETGKEQLAHAEKALLDAKNRQHIESETIKKVRVLDERIVDQKTHLQGLEKESEDKQAELAENQHKMAKNEQKIVEFGRKMSAIDDFCKKHACDEVLVAEKSGIEAELKNLMTLSTDVDSAQKKVNSCQKSQKNAEKSQKTAVQCLEKAKIAKNEAKKQRNTDSTELEKVLKGRLLREYRAEHEGLMRERAYVQKITSLEEERSKLVAGQPCPLCGATEHPFADGTVPQLDDMDRKINALSALIKQAEKGETKVAEVEKACISAQNRAENAEKDLKNANKSLLEVQKAVDEAETASKSIAERFETNKGHVLQLLQPMGVEALPDDLVAFFEELTQRATAWQEQQTKRENLEKQLHQVESDHKQLTGIIQTLETAQNERKNVLKSKNDALNTLFEERKGLFGEKDVEKEEKRLSEAVSTAEKAEKSLMNELQALNESYTALKTGILNLQQDMAERAAPLEAQEQAFLLDLQKLDFKDEEAFKTARLPVDDRTALEQEEKSLEARRADVVGRQKDRREKLTVETEKRLTEQSLEELQQEIEGFSVVLKELGEKIGGLKQRLADDADAKNRFAEKQQMIEKQKREFQRWSRLHELIGSSDGKKYRNFAQGLTFELMVSHANRQLESMSDRYLLIRDDKEPLELNVVDNYQAGEIRSTRNLSGGESFIVSLSLALGLSKMASRKVRVDSLFLDEGFGTLDEDALETALETLAGLQQNGKLIGIISHVPALKERISTQLTIHPQSGGKSTVTGPGCQKAKEKILEDVKADIKNVV